MPVKDKRIDDYIIRSAVFAQPILQHLRKIIHMACPAVTETMKWSFPHFEYKGSILCSMASFKQHCAFGFWLAALMQDPDDIFNASGKTAMGHLGQIRSVNDLPKDYILIRYIKEAMLLIEQGAKLPKKSTVSTGKTLEIPEYFQKALNKNKAAKDQFEAFPYSHKKEYVEWIVEAKTEPTRDKRMAAALEWIAEGKGRNWKYER